MKRAAPWNEAYPISSEDSSDSSSEDDGPKSTDCDKKNVVAQSRKAIMSEDSLIQRAKMYQEYMKHVSIPLRRGSVIPFTSWQGLARSMKQLYGQPLHYLTNTILKQWDQLRVGTEDEHVSLDSIIHPSKAEALIWVTEEVHRRTSSHLHLAKLWASDAMYHAFIDPIFPGDLVPV